MKYYEGILPMLQNILLQNISKITNQNIPPPIFSHYKTGQMPLTKCKHVVFFKKAGILLRERLRDSVAVAFKLLGPVGAKAPNLFKPQTAKRKKKEFG